MQKLYLYLAARNKKGIKIIATLLGEIRVTSRLTEVESLNLPTIWQNQIVKIVHDNRMLYEPWLETASSYDDLKKRLVERGYSELPMGAIPILNLLNYNYIPKADTSSCRVRTTMLRRKQG